MRRALFMAPMLVAGLLLTACGGGDDVPAPAPDPGAPSPSPSPSPTPSPAPSPTPSPSPSPTPTPTPPPATDANVLPAFAGNVAAVDYDGNADDLLTGGLGWDGLQGAAPAVSSPPTAAELRRLAIYSNYRALVDMSADGGYGRLYGPNVPLDGSAPLATPGAGKVAGTEYITYANYDGGGQNVTLMVQVPATFDVANPCIVSGTSSGSRGVYGAISVAGEWGLKRGCAVAYTDKGTGNGAHELATDLVTLIDGTVTDAATAGAASLFTATRLAPPAGDNRPNRYAFKHAHSQRNPERDWGLNTLQAIEFAFWAINEKHGATDAGGARLKSFVPANTVVIAAGVSNGGGASLRAAEQDAAGLIDGVVAGEPQVSVNVGFPQPAFNLVRGTGAPLPANAYGKPLIHYVGTAALFQSCASYASTNAGAPLQNLVPQPQAEARCQDLVDAGLLAATNATFEQRADAARDALRLGGWEPESDVLHPWHWGSSTTLAVAVTYNNAYARAAVNENVCDFNFASVGADGRPAAPATPVMPTIFGAGNGIPPTAGLAIVYNAVPGTAPTGGPINFALLPDQAFAGIQCLRALWRTRTPNPTAGSLAARLQAGVDEVLASGNLQGKPALIVHGRADALVPVNHSSRTYFGANQLAEGANSRLSYIEVTNAQHFDALLGLAGFNERFVPLHVYKIQALDAMWNHLRSGAPLPGSQVLRTTPRGAGAPALTAANVPAIVAAPAAGDAITFTANTVTVPD